MQRNIGLCILFTILTCGIYGIYWFVVLTDDVARLSDDSSMSGGMALLFSILTCGIYSFYWAYKVGKLMSIAQGNRGVRESDNSVLYILLSIFGLQIVVYAIIQSHINDLAGELA